MPVHSLRGPAVLLRLLLLLLLPVVLLGAPAPAAAQIPYLVKDVSPGEDPAAGVGPLFITSAGDLLFFWGHSEAEGQEVWRSDGTPGGTFLLRDITPGPDTSDSNGSDDNEVAAAGDLFFFVAKDGDIFGGELWRSDGTPAGTFQVTETVPGPGGLEPEQLTPSGGLLYFLLQSAFESGLWRSDGTPEGTFAIDLGEDAFGPGLLTDVGGTLFFFSQGASGRFTLWRSDGTEAGTVEVTELPAGWNFLVETADLSGTLFFGVSTGTGAELWKSDGTAAGTVRVKAFGPGTDFPEEPTPVGGRLFFRLADAAGAELWASDGTEAGTHRVADIRPGPASSFPFALTAAGSTLYFSADDGAHGFELWRSDGTAAGTTLVADILPGPGSSSPLGLTGAGGLLLFSATDPDVEGGLWRSDGTPAGTFRLGEVALDSSSTEVGVEMAVMDGTVYFSGTDGVNGFELWKSDGTEAGTQAVSERIAGVSSRIEELTDLGGTLFFRAETEFSGPCGLWRSDGTEPGTTPVPAAGGGEPVCPLELTPAAGALFFRERAGSPRLWKAGGPAATTAVVVADGAAGLSSLGELESAGGLLLFTGCGPAAGCELWKSDGTASGTVPVADLAPGPASSTPRRLTRVGGLVFFEADAGSGVRLWRSDGSAAGTFSVGDRTGRVRTAFGSLLFFVAPGADGGDVWRSDGTPAGTFRAFLGYGGGRIERLTVASGAMFFFVRRDAAAAVDLWRMTADASGVRLETFAGTPEDLGAAGGRFYFSLEDVATGREPWASDGTAAGTRRVADILPGPGSSVPQLLGEAFGRAVFAATDGIHGQEVWLSDGTAAGTFQLPDIAPGGGSSSPGGFTVSGPRVFFAADDGIASMAGMAGRELWAFSLNVPPAITSLAVTPVPAARATTVTASAAFADPDPGDVLTARLFWGDGTSSTPGTAGGTLRATHAYAKAGLYDVTLRLTDAAGEQASRVFEHAVIYDPAGPAVAGDGTIATHQGQATFQLAADYVTGRRAPQGSVQFRVPGFDLKSRLLRWLVVRGNAAWIEGEGTLNGRGRYRFRAFAVDAQATGGGGADRFRISIYDLASGALAYDSEPGAPDDATPRTPLGAGAIQIQ